MNNFPIFNVNLLNYEIKHIENIKTCRLSNFSPNLHIISEVVHWHRAKKRKSFASALSKGDVKGTGKKPFAQKGKGMARQGSLKNPHQRGGGVAFPPTKRDFTYKINKKKIRQALQSIVFTRLMEDRIIIIDKIELTQPSSLIIRRLLNIFNFKKVLFIDLENIYLKLSTRNFENVKFLAYNGINTLDLTNFPHILLTKKVFQKLLFSFFP